MEVGKLKLFGKDIFGNPVEQAGGLLERRYTWVPFSVLNARDGKWLNRKRAWLAMGIKSELGRGGDGIYGGCRSPEVQAKFESAGPNFSVFDPVLCELMYTWFCPAGGQIVDPFAGGSVRGVVASSLGFRYWGCDLNPQQIEANKKQGRELCGNNKPVWVYGDSAEEIRRAPEADMIFSCPPYANLEVYTDDPRDLSNMEYPDFLKAYEKIIRGCYKRLKSDRFACFVVGDIRDKKGNYYGFVADTIKTFQKCGFNFYNDAVLMTPAGSLSIRAGISFDATRKLGKAHQNVLVFVKGDPKKATEKIKGDK